MSEAFKHNIANIFNIKGRESRSSFWFYVLVLMLISAVLQLVWAVLIGAVGGDMDLSAFLRWQIWLFFGTNLLFILLLLAAFVRRLHDISLSGWVALIPMGLYGYVLYGSLELLSQARAEGATDSPAQLAQFMNGFAESEWLYIASAIATFAIIIFGVLAPYRGTNAYGPAPTEGI